MMSLSNCLKTETVFTVAVDLCSVFAVVNVAFWKILHNPLDRCIYCFSLKPLDKSQILRKASVTQCWLDNTWIIRGGMVLLFSFWSKINQSKINYNNILCIFLATNLFPIKYPAPVLFDHITFLLCFYVVTVWLLEYFQSLLLWE